MDQLSESAVKAVADLADRSSFVVQSFSVPTGVKGVPTAIPILISPRTGEAKSLANLIEPWRTRPERKTGTAHVDTIESFIELLERHKTEHSAIFADTDWNKPSLTAVVDYSSSTDADFGQHRIHYSFPRSEEWKVWVGKHSRPLSQVDFAEFIEDHIQDLSAPDTLEEEQFERLFSCKVGYPNDLVMLSRGLQINAEVRVKTALKLQSGESQIVFEEDHKNADGQPISVPGVFIINIPIFHGGASTRIPVRLRYKLRDGAINWTFMLHRPDVYITEEVRRDLERAARETELPKFEGKPEA